MNQTTYSRLIGLARGRLGLVVALLAGGQALAQPTITATAPTANAPAAARTSAVAVTFSQPLVAGSGAALAVYSAQRGGLRSRGSSAAVVSGNTLRFSPGSYPFMPGETVLTTVTRAAASSSGSLATGKVFQFTAAVGGSGNGNFQPGGEVAVGGYLFALATADVDGDGDLDFVTADQGSNLVTVRLNGGDNLGSNTGVFSGGSTVAVGYNPYSLVLGDVDGDGDLDLLTADYGGGGQISVRLNGGDATGSSTGVFSGGSQLAVAYAYGLTLGDVDGDGDLDLLVASNSYTGQVSVRLNGGDATGSHTGLFSNGTTVPVDASPYCVAVSDVDNDGDLDLLTTYSPTGRVTVRLNGGDATGSNTGTFSNGSTVLVNGSPYGLVLGDVDSDGDADLLTANASSNTVSVRLNGGDATGSATGVFSGNSNVSVGNNPMALALGDVDGDGDLDMMTANYLGNTVSVRLNGGDATGSHTGTFSAGSTVAVATRPFWLALGDADGDGDLDMVVAGAGTGAVSVRVNQPAPTLGSLAAQEPAGRFEVAPTVGTGPAPRYTYAGPPLSSGSTLALYSSLGQQVWAAPVSGPVGFLPTAGLAAGWYFVHLQTEKQQFVARFYQP